MTTDRLNADRVAQITCAVHHYLESLPEGALLVAAAKGRSVPEVEVAIEAGIAHVGHNYVQEAQAMVPAVGGKVTWHMIGHLQRNKAGKVVQLFDLIETLDSIRLAQALERRCAAADKSLPVLIEVNSGREPNKAGVLPEDLARLVDGVADLPHLQLRGLMTMGPAFGDPEDARPYFQATRMAFEALARRPWPNVEMQYLSMGMSNSFRVALQEGANVVRIGTGIFGSRR